MTDLNIPADFSRDATVADDTARLRQAIELLFFAYRDSTSDSDEILAGEGYGRAHHRVIHFVGANPGINVAQLLAILRITKQSLGRVLKQLVDNGFIEQRPGEYDRRQRLLYLTSAGRDMERRLSMPQHQRLRRAFAVAGETAVAGYLKVLENLLNEPERQSILEHIKGG